MPVLQVNLNDMADVQAALKILRQQREAAAKPQQGGNPAQQLAQSVGELKHRKIWRFLNRVSRLNVPEYSLPELAEHLEMTTNKVCSLRAILAKPEQRLKVQFLEPASSGTVDASGNPRYQMPEPIKQAIQKVENGI